MIELLLILVIVHFAVDYQFQSESIALGKNRKIDKAQYGVNWWYWMLSHSATHGIAIFLVTGNILACMCETAIHFIIDAGKCEGKYGLHIDQCLHIVSKLIIVWIVVSYD